MSSTECPARVSSKSVLSRVSRKSVKKECQARVSCQDCSVKSVQQKCRARVCSKSVQQECQERVSCKSVLPRVCSKRVLSRVPCKTLLLLDDCASHLHKEKTSIFISALVSVHSALHKVTAFGFVGSIKFFLSAANPDPFAGNTYYLQENGLDDCNIHWIYHLHVGMRQRKSSTQKTPPTHDCAVFARPQHAIVSA